MLEHSKHILERVSFDRKLFRKELLKAIKWLKKEEAVMLKVWCLSNFVVYTEVINVIYKRFV